MPRTRLLVASATAVVVVAGGATLAVTRPWDGAADPGGPRCDGKVATVVAAKDAEGTEGDDVVLLTAEYATYDGRGGDDTICTAAGSRATVDGGEGDDHIHVRSRNSPGVAYDGTLRGGPGDDVLIGGRGRDVFVGGAGDDVMRGGRAGDVFRGSAGEDELHGGPGPDEFYPDATDGADLIDGGPGPGLDALVFRDTSATTLRIDRGTFRIRSGATGSRFRGIESYAGSPERDVIIGSERADEIDGWNGRDRIEGRGGDDRLTGDGELIGGAGDDRITVTSVAGVADRAPFTTVDGGPGDDHLDLGQGRGDAQAGPGDDTVDYRERRWIADGGPGRDTLRRYCLSSGYERVCTQMTFLQSTGFEVGPLDFG